MLEKVRKPSRAKGVLAYFIFGAIIIVFIGFGMSPNRLGYDATGVAAVVNRSQISLADFRDRVQAMEQQYRSRLDQVPASQRQDMTKALKQRALEDLIQFEAMVQAAADRGVGVADEEVRDYILEIPSFQDEGRFKRDYYNRFLEQRQWTSGQFEERVRKDLVMRKAQSLFAAALRPTGLEEQKDRATQATKLSLEVLTLNDELLKSHMPISAGDLSAYLGKKENIEALQKIFEENQAQYSEPEQVRARHILVKVDPSQKGADAAAKKKIEELAERAKTEDFGKLAEANSDDTGSKIKGGDLGYFTRERMVPEFAGAAFSGQVGKITGPVRTDFGYHIIKVEDHKPSRKKSFDEVKSDLAKTELAKSRAEGVLKEIETKVKSGDEVGVRKLAKDLKLDWQQVDSVHLDATQVPQLADTDKVIEAVVKGGGKKGLLPEVIKAKTESLVVVVKNLAKEEGKTEALADYLSSRKYYDAFNGWARSVITKAEIHRNGTLF